MKAPAPHDRLTRLEDARRLKMARSAHAYVRGNTVQFYEWLLASPVARRVPDGPAAWICGDCHLGNLGPLADRDGRVEVQIRDLDQTVIGNPAHDLIRLGLSLATAARGSDLPGVVTARMIEDMVDGYDAAFRDPLGEAGAEPEAVRSVRRRALGRKWRHLARERLEDVEPAIPIGRKFWSLSRDERESLAAVLLDERICRTVLSLDEADARRIRLVDAAYWVKGCSSLGLLRVAAIVALEGKVGRDYALLDLKEAAPSVAPTRAGAAMPSDDGERVVAGARALSPNLGRRMIAAHALGRSLFVRELAPQDLKIEVDQFSKAEAVRAARHLAFVVGRAHACQLDEAERAEWLRLLAADRRTALDAPSWLWESVVSLAASHEAGYLEHCRRYALAA